MFSTKTEPSENVLVSAGRDNKANIMQKRAAHVAVKALQEMEQVNAATG